MPDHLHAVVAFPKPEEMSKVVGAWKRWHSRRDGVFWQDEYFDHRIRDEGRGEHHASKTDYIAHNPVRAGLCEWPEDWPWKIVAGRI